MRVSMLYSLRELRVFGFICAASCLGRVVPLTQIYSSWNTFFFYVFDPGAVCRGYKARCGFVADSLRFLFWLFLARWFVKFLVSLFESHCYNVN